MELKQNTPNRRATESSIRDERAAAQLLGQLQTTLEPTLLISIFCKEIKSLVPHNGFLYQQASFGIEHHEGQRAHHSCNYELNLESSKLGSLKLFRRKRFDEAELRLLETLLSYLFYPLRNALMYQQAVRSAHTDELTGLFNRTTLTSIFERESVLAKRRKTPFSLLMLDIDYFKQVNDRYGHAMGDQALIAFADCLKTTLRGSDAIFRTGGEEFVVILSDTHLEGAHQLAERLRQAVEALHIEGEKGSLQITTSIGVAQFSGETSAANLADRADKALYQAKQAGRNQVKLAN